MSPNSSASATAGGTLEAGAWATTFTDLASHVLHLLFDRSGAEGDKKGALPRRTSDCGAAAVVSFFFASSEYSKVGLREPLVYLFSRLLLFDRFQDKVELFAISNGSLWMLSGKI